MRKRVSVGRAGALDATSVRVPGDKSIAHRWLILAATAAGSSRLVEVPTSLDVRSTAACLAALSHDARRGLQPWVRNSASSVEAGGSTWNLGSSERVEASASPALEVEGNGRGALSVPVGELDCGNSGTSMRLLAGVLAGAPFRTVLTGDPSLNRRPMERIATPLRAMGAAIATTDGHAPITITGGELTGIRYEVPVASAQVKSAVLFAGAVAIDETTLIEPAPTRDHTERAFRALNGDVRIEGSAITVRPFQHGGFEGRVPGDPSSAAFLVAAAALTGSRLTVRGVGVNPTRTRYLEVMRRMNVGVTIDVTGEQVGEPVGDIRIDAPPGIAPVVVGADELPLVIDEVPVLAALAAYGDGPSWFEGAGELRLKESDRLGGLADRFRALDHHAAVEGDALMIAGGGIGGGRIDAGGDHRIAMAFAVAALAADRPIEIDGMDAEAVSFPGFSGMLRDLGAPVEELPT